MSSIDEDQPSLFSHSDSSGDPPSVYTDTDDEHVNNNYNGLSGDVQESDRFILVNTDGINEIWWNPDFLDDDDYGGLSGDVQESDRFILVNPGDGINEIWWNPDFLDDDDYADDENDDEILSAPAA